MSELRRNISALVTRYGTQAVEESLKIELMERKSLAESIRNTANWTEEDYDAADEGSVPPPTKETK